MDLGDQCSTTNKTYALIKGREMGGLEQQEAGHDFASNSHEVLLRFLSTPHMMTSFNSYKVT